MRASRRDVLRVLAQTAAAYGLGGTVARAAGEASPVTSFEETLASYLDTLMPGDDLSPSAVELGIFESILNEARANPNVLEFLEGGVGWLDEEARRQGVETFAVLSDVGRNQVVAVAESAEPETLENDFFRATRFVVVRLYYTDPRTWPAIGYDGPPQPVGFPDYAEPPAGAE